MFKVLKEQLKKPSKESYPWVIWIWNGNISREALIKELEWIVSSSFGGVIIRPGREIFPTYLSEEFLELCGIVLGYGKQYGFSVRFGEDFLFSTPSVFQQEVSQTKALRAQQLKLIDQKILSESQEFLFDDYCVERDLILTYEIKNGTIDPNSVLELTPSEGSNVIKWLPPQNGCYGIMVFRKEFMICPEGDAYLPNFFNTKTASLYIQTVFTKYKELFSKYIPSVFEGFFIELPFTLCPANREIPWDDDFIVKFRSKTKKNIIKILPALYSENFPSAPKNREQIYSFIKDSIYERFVSALEGWVKKYRLSTWIAIPEKNFSEAKWTLTDGYV
ncbi:MAG: hypothetical protein N2053_00305, partial [Chitinispirillaceae bacterium]|nr:hypothetical protein [Chitinispirillaceae bacterium]